MPLAGPFVHLDYAATPTEEDDGAGGTVLVYPPLAGVFAICDLDTFAQSAELLTPFRVWPVPAQSVLAGDDPADPQATVTLHFPDDAEAGPVFEAVAALPPVPSSSPPPDVPPFRRLIPKSLVQERVNDLGRLGAAFELLNALPIQFGRWFAPDWPNVYHDDAGLLQILAAIGCTAEEIETITSPA